MGAEGQSIVGTRINYRFVRTFIRNSDEHQRRSPDCMFFTLSATKSKAGRAKKGRASTASRLSIQSNITAVTESASVLETEAIHDQSVSSITDTVKPMKGSKGGRKATKPRKASSKVKGKAAIAKQDELQIASSFVEPEDDDFEVKVTQAPAPITDNKKRKSEQISVAEFNLSESPANFKDERIPTPPRKRRATRASNNVVPVQEVPISRTQTNIQINTQVSEVEERHSPSNLASKKTRKGSKKRASSTSRKASTASTASKASLRAGIPNDREIDAALEAELNRPLTDEEGEFEPSQLEPRQARRLTRTKPASKKAKASVAPTRRGTRASTLPPEDTLMADPNPLMPMPEDNVPETVPTRSTEAISSNEILDHSPRVKGTRKASARQPNLKRGATCPEDNTTFVDRISEDQRGEVNQHQRPGSRQISRQLSIGNAASSVLADGDDLADPVSDVNSSALDMQTAADDSGHETDASVAKKGRANRSSRRDPSATRKTNARKRGKATSRNVEDIVHPTTSETPSEGIEDQKLCIMATDHESISVGQALMEVEPPNNEPQTANGATNLTKGKKKGPKTKPTTRKASAALKSDAHVNGEEEQDVKILQPFPSVHSTPRPALSHQSSDAENHPPSSRPSTQRPPLSLQSPSQSQSTRILLAPTTPTASPTKGTFQRLQTTYPWTTVDLEQIFQESPAVGMENNPFSHGGPKDAAKNALTSPEKKLSVEEWIQFNARREEEKLRNECERLVGRFESEGMRALRALEGIVCVE